MKFVIILSLVAAANAFPLAFMDASAFKGLAQININPEAFLANRLSQLKMIANGRATEEPVPYKLATEEPVPYMGETEEPVPYENPEAPEHMPFFELPIYDEADAPEFIPEFVNVLPFNEFEVPNKLATEEPVPYKLFTEEPVPYKSETEEPVPYENPEAPEHMPFFELPVYDENAPEFFPVFVNVMPFTEEPVPYKVATEEPVPYKQFTEEPVPYKSETEEPVPYENPEAPEHMLVFELPVYDASAPETFPMFVNVIPFTEEPVPYKLATEEPVPYKVATEEPVPYMGETEEPVPYENPEAPEHMPVFELPEYDADAPMIMPAFVNVMPVTEEPVPY